MLMLLEELFFDLQIICWKRTAYYNKQKNEDEEDVYKLFGWIIYSCLNILAKALIMIKEDIDVEEGKKRMTIN